MRLTEGAMAAGATATAATLLRPAIWLRRIIELQRTFSLVEHSRRYIKTYRRGCLEF